jgi:hypothetical protein
MEGAEWVFNAARNEWQMMEADKIRNEAKKMSAKEVEANKMQIFERFLETLKR